jgi:hypothetical protein
VFRAGTGAVETALLALGSSTALESRAAQSLEVRFFQATGGRWRLGLFSEGQLVGFLNEAEGGVGTDLAVSINGTDVSGQLLFPFAEPNAALPLRGLNAAIPQSVPRTIGVQANKLMGDTARNLIAAREAPARIEQVFVTIGGVRRVDVLKLGDELIAIESKVGPVGLKARVRRELARDWWLRRQGQVDRVIWEFSPSPTTGLGGPNAPLLEKLRKLGFEVRTNP